MSTVRRSLLSRARSHRRPGPGVPHGGARAGLGGCRRLPQPVAQRRQGQPGRHLGRVQPRVHLVRRLAPALPQRVRDAVPRQRVGLGHRRQGPRLRRQLDARRRLGRVGPQRPRGLGRGGVRQRRHDRGVQRQRRRGLPRAHRRAVAVPVHPLQGPLARDAPTPPPPPPAGNGGKAIENVAASRCLDVAAGSNAAGTPIQIYDCNGTAAQQWIAGSGALRVFAGSCLDVPNSALVAGTRGSAVRRATARAPSSGPSPRTARSARPTASASRARWVGRPTAPAPASPPATAASRSSGWGRARQRRHGGQERQRVPVPRRLRGSDEPGRRDPALRLQRRPPPSSGSPRPVRCAPTPTPASTCPVAPWSPGRRCSSGSATARPRSSSPQQSDGTIRTSQRAVPRRRAERHGSTARVCRSTPATGSSAQSWATA